MQKRSSIGAKYKSYYTEIFIMQKSRLVHIPEHVRSLFPALILPLLFKYRKTKEDRYGWKNHIYAAPAPSGSVPGRIARRPCR